MYYEDVSLTDLLIIMYWIVNAILSALLMPKESLPILHMTVVLHLQLYKPYEMVLLSYCILLRVLDGGALVVLLAATTLVCLRAYLTILFRWQSCSNYLVGS